MKLATVCSGITFHCLFEQSGTFKNVFKSHGHQAYDYDILNDYGQTDFQIDLFEEIEIAYDKLILKCKNDCSYPLCDEPCAITQKTIFDDMKPETDFIIAFFPCTYFSDQNELQFKLQSVNGIKFNNRIPIQYLSRVMNRDTQRSYYFQLFLKFCFICQHKEIKTIIENPSSPILRSYLELYSPYRPSWREKDRTLFGDKFRKPTNFFAINFDMQEQFMMFDEEHNKKSLKGRGTKRVKEVYEERNQKKRSEITPRYANNFYKRFIEQWVESKVN